MEFSGTTFVLEIINFLVLVWLLKRFLYAPILSILEQRRNAIQRSLDESAERQQQAIELEQQYKKRLEEWALEKQQLKESLQQELLEERAQRHEQMETELSNEREKAAIAEQRQRSELLAQYQRSAHQQGARFAAELLAAVASEELEARLFDLLMASFDQLSDAHKACLLNHGQSTPVNVNVASVYVLSAAQRQQLEQKLQVICQQTLNIDYTQDAQLLAGLRILIGATVLGINLQDELRDYVELARET